MQLLRANCCNVVDNHTAPPTAHPTPAPHRSHRNNHPRPTTRILMTDQRQWPDSVRARRLVGQGAKQSSGSRCSGCRRRGWLHRNRRCCHSTTRQHSAATVRVGPAFHVVICVYNTGTDIVRAPPIVVHGVAAQMHLQRASSSSPRPSGDRSTRPCIRGEVSLRLSIIANLVDVPRSPSDDRR